MTPTLILFLLTSPSALAYTGEELQFRKNSFTELAQAFSRAESEMGLLDGLDYTSRAVEKIAPPNSCKKATQFYDSYMQVNRKQQDNAAAMVRWFEDETKKFDHSRMSFQMLCAGRNKIAAFKKEMVRLHMDLEFEKISNDPEIMRFETEDGVEKGEFAVMKCALPISAIMQFRKKQLALLNKSFGFVEAGIDAACDYQAQGIDDALRILHDGEQAYMDFQERQKPR